VGSGTGGEAHASVESLQGRDADGVDGGAAGRNGLGAVGRSDLEVRIGPVYVYGDGHDMGSTSIGGEHIDRARFRGSAGGGDGKGRTDNRAAVGGDGSRGSGAGCCGQWGAWRASKSDRGPA